MRITMNLYYTGQNGSARKLPRRWSKAAPLPKSAPRPAICGTNTFSR